MKKQVLLILSLCLTIIVQAQESITTSGGNVSGSGGSTSYVVGQIVYTTSTGANGSVMPGVLQPFEISVLSGNKEVEDITLMVSVYPNPTTDYLILKVGTFQLSTLNFQLFDMNGKIIESNKLESNETSIRMNNLIQATYFLKIIDNNKEVKTFKIIKN